MKRDSVLHVACTSLKLKRPPYLCSIIELSVYIYCTQKRDVRTQYCNQYIIYMDASLRRVCEFAVSECVCCGQTPVCSEQCGDMDYGVGDTVLCAEDFQQV